MVEAGADVIFGHHSHRLKPVGEVDGKPVVWGLGNFVWPTFSGPGATTAVARVVISPSGANTSCLIPAHIESSGHPVLVGIPPCGAR
jgi:poly-gamma-glutamate capsule biosynthesis protein CapA/YwtB (metallophosphatase superfamily)